MPIYRGRCCAGGAVLQYLKDGWLRGSGFGSCKFYRLSVVLLSVALSNQSYNCTFHNILLVCSFQIVCYEEIREVRRVVTK